MPEFPREVARRFPSPGSPLHTLRLILRQLSRLPRAFDLAAEHSSSSVIVHDRQNSFSLDAPLIPSSLDFG
jgi:hypothetical protein